ncbi:MAG: class I SAM-dependent methyltransferase [Verrucomicrobiales bacterium]
MKAELSDVDRAHAVYTKRRLDFYDWWVLGLSNPRIWKCPTEKLEDLYREHLSANHLEVGAGTGYFLEKTLPELDAVRPESVRPESVRPESAQPRVALLDINRACLEKASARISGHRPETYEHNVLEPFERSVEKFDSIAVNYLLHCLPGRIETKAEKVFDNLAPHLEDGGVVFGATLLGKDIQRPLLARCVMRFYNRRGIFSNSKDTLGAVMEVLAARFKTFEVEVVGCVVLFWGKGLRDSYRERISGRDR